MDPEQTFLRVHARLSEMLSPRIRTALEYVFLVAAIALFGLLVIMHTNFVQQPGCSSEFTRNEIAKANLVQIKITSNDPWLQSAAKTIMTEASEQGISSENLKAADLSGEGFSVLTTKSWINWFGSGARKGKLVFKSWKSGREFLEARMECIPENSHSIPSTGEKSSRIAIEAVGIVFGSVWESLETPFVYLFNKWQEYFDFFGKNIKDNLGSVNKQQWEEIEHGDTWWNFLRVILKWMRVFWSEGIESFTIQLLEKKSRTFEPTYMYTVEKGYLLLPEAAKSEHSIQTVNISISPWNSCFGNRWQQLLINLFVGYDTILVNSLLNTPGQGYLYNFQTREFYDLSHAHEPAEGHSQFEVPADYIVTKSGVLIMSLFVFFTTTMPVSFTLRETQSRMLKFTVQLQHHAQHQLPTFQLIFVHVIESLVFVPIMIGILFFLFEFYDDQMLAFMVLTLVWLCELFTMISVRTSISMQFFPRFFVLYFLVFHIYYFSYAYGFSYLAFWTTAAFMLHLILYFWNRFEVPALQRFLQNQSQLQQQTGVHITSSTILTSTLHITRVNVSNPTTSGPELGLPTELDPGQPDLLGAVDTNGSYEPAVSDNPEMIDAPSESDSQQNEDTQNSGSLNSFSSLLLWILGGASSDNLVSFFSMFREMRQGQVYPEPGQQDNHLSGGQSSWWRRR